MMNRIAQSRLFRQFWGYAGAVSVRVKVLGIVLSMIVLLALFVILRLRAVMTATLTLEIQGQGHAINHYMIEHLPDVTTLPDSDGSANDLLVDWRDHYSSASHNTLVDYILLVDDSGAVLAHTFDGDVPQAALDAGVPEMTGGHDSVRLLPVMGGDASLEITSALPDEAAFVRLGMSREKIRRTVNTVTWQIMYVTGVMIATGMAGSFLLTWILTRPILSLVDATRAVAQGDFGRQVPRWADDEIGELSESFNAMTRALAQAEKERQEQENLRRQYVSRVIEAQEDERKRIARELHDSTSQSLTSMLVGLRNLEQASDPPELNGRIDELRSVVSATLEEVHVLAWQLRPSVLDDLGLVTALQRYLADVQRRSGIQLDFAAHGLDDRLPVALETAIYRIVQETVTNIVRHANATTASVLVEQRAGTVRVIVEDNGQGFDAAAAARKESSLGLQGIHERARLFNGKVTLESEPGRGASIFVLLAIP